MIFVFFLISLLFLLASHTYIDSKRWHHIVVLCVHRLPRERNCVWKRDVAPELAVLVERKGKCGERGVVRLES